MSSISSCMQHATRKSKHGWAKQMLYTEGWKRYGKAMVRLYESIVLSTLLYGAETWPITVANGRRLEAAHHRWLRRTLHVSWRDKIPKKTIRERIRQKELGCIIRRERLTFLGHVARMNNNRP